MWYGSSEYYGRAVKNDLQHSHFSSVATFMRSPYISIEECGNYDAVALGVPVDHGVSFRSGQRFGPSAIREASFWYSLRGQEVVNLDDGRTCPVNSLRLGDLGDVEILPGDAEGTHSRVAETLEQIAGRAFPLILGGDHSITYGAFMGCRRALSRCGVARLGMLHFDAHLDTEGTYHELPRVHHGNAFRTLIEEDELIGGRMVTVGVRGYEGSGVVDFGRRSGIRTHSVRSIRTRSLETTLTDISQYLSDNCDGVYVSFDIDCIDPSQAPGTGTPALGGLSVSEVLDGLKLLRTLPVVAFDLVELSPPLDTTGLSAIVAAEVIWNFLAFGLRVPTAQRTRTASEEGAPS
jgi:formimidoylglutamase